jgi:GNAT superfamily N-acetyltransferase
MRNIIKHTATHQFTLTDETEKSWRKAINNQIKAFNNAISPQHLAARQPNEVRPLDIYIHDQQGDLVGGLIADTYWGWLDIDDFWLADALRGQGYGRYLLYAAEKEALKRGCTRAQLKTFSFQAPGFYKKQGYFIVGQLDDYPPGESLIWLRKELND